MKKTTLLLIYLCCFLITKGENGYDLWLRYKPVTNKALLTSYRENITTIIADGSSATMKIVKEELFAGLSGLLQTKIDTNTSMPRTGAVIAGTPHSSLLIRNAGITTQLEDAGEEGFVIISRTINGKACTLISGNTEQGVLYGVFHFLGGVRQ